MSKTVKTRLNNLALRRTGFKKASPFEMGMDALSEAYSAPPEERYQRRATEENTKYTLGARQEVEPKYTRVSLSEADRVRGQLQTGFDTLKIAIDFKIQGSVAANLHIKGSSDVDMLLLDDRFYTYDTTGSKAQFGGYTSPYMKGATESLQELRTEAIKILRDKYPTATVNAGPKAIGLSGGSLRRDVDVVPSHWHDTAEYQQLRQDYYRSVYILDNDQPSRLLNMPFLHIQRIDEKDRVANGSLRKSIRLCKNVKVDFNDEGGNIHLSSYDIAATMWHSNLHILKYSDYQELGILGETARHLQFLQQNHLFAQTLVVPDGTRKIFDRPEKLESLATLSREVTDLAIEVAIEQGGGGGWAEVEKSLRNSFLV